MSDSEGDETELDPRIQIELEKLNTTTDEINRLEIEYDVSLSFNKNYQWLWKFECFLTFQDLPFLMKDI